MNRERDKEKECFSPIQGPTSFRGGGIDGGRDASIVEALRLDAARIEPDPAFVERLSARLRKDQPARNPLPARTRTRRLLYGAAAIAAAVLLALVLPALLGSKHNLPPLPRLVYAAAPESPTGGAGLLAGAKLTLETNLPDAPDQVPVYRITTSSPSTTPEEAAVWARDFGLVEPQVYRDPREPEAIFAVGAEGRTLTFRPIGAMGTVFYRDDRAAIRTGAPLPFDEAVRAAVAFLNEHSQAFGLPRLKEPEDPQEPRGPIHLTLEGEAQTISGYRAVEPQGWTLKPEDPVHVIQVVPEVDGRPLAGYGSEMQVAVNPEGEVTYAIFTPVFAPAAFAGGGVYPIKSAEEAYEELTGRLSASGVFRLDVDRSTLSSPEIRSYYPETTYAPGEQVTVTGWVQLLLAEEGSAARARLSSRDCTQYDLTGPRLAELAAAGSQNVQVEGTITAQVGPQRWQMEMVDWGIAPRLSPICPTGTLSREGSDAWLVTEQGQRYGLPNAPNELADGERLQVCANDQPADGGTMAWWQITSPPASEQAVTSGSSSVSVVVQPVEVISETVASPRWHSPFEIGQGVEVTGTVRATIYVNGDARRVEVDLDVDESGQDLPPYPISGPADLLEEIAKLDRLHIRVRGKAISAPEHWTTGEVGIAVESYEKVWPEEQVQGFLGQLELETLDGREVLVFVDKETGRRYVEASSLELGASGRVPTSAADSPRQVFVRGVVQPGQTYAGLPVLRVVHGSQNSQTDAATRASEIPLDIPLVIDESGMPGESGLEGAFVVDRVELAYYYESPPSRPVLSPGSTPPVPQVEEQILQPVWVFYGHDAGNTTTLAAYVQAVVDEYVQEN